MKPGLYRCEGRAVEVRKARRAYTCLICSNPTSIGDKIAYFPRKQIVCHMHCFVREVRNAGKPIRPSAVRKARTIV